MQRQMLTTVYTVINETQSKRKSIDCIEKTGLQWFINDFKKYIRTISVKNNELRWQFNGTGPKWRELCDVISYIWVRAGWYEHQKIESELEHFDINELKMDNLDDISFDLEILIPSLIWAAKYVSHKNIRRAYSAMFRQSVEIVHPSQIPYTIQCIQYYYRKGWDEICQLDKQMV